MQLICQRCNCRSHLVAGAEALRKSVRNRTFHTIHRAVPAFPVP
nr:hypothetical protein JVH1_4439 [Rhodococcus sp. JVH1]